MGQVISDRAGLPGGVFRGLLWLSHPSAVSNDPTLAVLLATVEGIEDTYNIPLPSGFFLVGCSAEGFTGCELEEICTQVIAEANHIAWMFEELQPEL